MVSSPYVLVVCDRCGAEFEVELRATARGYSDDIGPALEEEGWTEDHCPGCQEEKLPQGA